MKKEPLKGKYKIYALGKVSIDIQDVKAAVEWLRYQILHTSKPIDNLIDEAFEDVIKE